MFCCFPIVLRMMMWMMMSYCFPMACDRRSRIAYRMLFSLQVICSALEEACKRQEGRLPSLSTTNFRFVEVVGFVCIVGLYRSLLLPFQSSG